MGNLEGLFHFAYTAIVFFTIKVERLQLKHYLLKTFFYTKQKSGECHWVRKYINIEINSSVLEENHKEIEPSSGTPLGT